MTEGRATARYVRTSAQKAKLVVDLIRGKDVDSALATLRFARKGVARDVEKVLRSAIANAQQRQGAGEEVERLYVRECYADQGPTLKRIRAAPMGRAFRVLKRTSHLTVVVDERPQGEVGARRRRRRGGADGGAGGGKRRRAAALPVPETITEPDVLEPDTMPEPEAPDTTPEPETVETDSVAEPAEPEPELGTPEPSEPEAPPEPEAPEPEEKEPEEPDEEPPTLPPGGILGIR